MAQGPQIESHLVDEGHFVEARLGPASHHRCGILGCPAEFPPGSWFIAVLAATWSQDGVESRQTEHARRPLQIHVIATSWTYARAHLSLFHCGDRALLGLPLARIEE